MKGKQHKLQSFPLCNSLNPHIILFILCDYMHLKQHKLVAQTQLHLFTCHKSDLHPVTISYTITHPRECAITDTLPPLDVKYGFRCVNMVYNLFSSSKSPRWTWSIKVQHLCTNSTFSVNVDFMYSQFPGWILGQLSPTGNLLL